MDILAYLISNGCNHARFACSWSPVKQVLLSSSAVKASRSRTTSSFSNEIYKKHDSHGQTWLRYARDMNLSCNAHSSHVYIEQILPYMGVAQKGLIAALCLKLHIVIFSALKLFQSWKRYCLVFMIFVLLFIIYIQPTRRIQFKLQHMMIFIFDWNHNLFIYLVVC